MPHQAVRRPPTTLETAKDPHTTTSSQAGLVHVLLGNLDLKRRLGLVLGPLHLDAVDLELHRVRELLGLALMDAAGSVSKMKVKA